MRRRNSRSNCRSAAGALACAVALAGCAAGRHDAGIPAPLRIASSERLRSLNPIYLSGQAGAAIGALAFSFLLRPRPDGRLVPDVAAVVPTLANGGISPDGLTITYRLRHGVRWQDGVPLTSADVAFTFHAILDPRNTIGSRDPFDRIAAIATPDAFTVRVRLRRPDAAVLGMFLTPDANAAILPRHLLARYAGLDRVAYDALPIGSGPYRIVRWRRDSIVRFEANEAYYGGAPRLPAIELRFTPDATTTLVQLQTGELDGVLGGEAALLDRYRALPRVRVTNVPYTGAEVLAFDVERPVVRDVAMRRALARAIDPSALARGAFRGAVTARDAARGLFSYADDPRVVWSRYDPQGAARALDALGWRLGPGGVRMRAGRALVLTLVEPNASNAIGTAALLVQQQLARVGVRLSVRSFVQAQFSAPAADGGPVTGGRFDLALIPYSTNVEPDQTWLLACAQRAPNGYNWSRYCNPRADALLAASTTTFDRTRRIAILRRLQRVVAADVPFLPLWQTREIDVTPARLRGFTPNGALPYASARDWSL